jgi:hypothetical protein
MTMSTVFNGRQPPHQQQRKQLSDQLDRFDQILDGLAEGLQDAVVDASREGCRVAVREAIQQILADPALRAVLVKLSAPVAARPSVWARVKATLGRLKAGVVRVATPVVAPVAEQVRTVTRAVGQVGRVLGITWQWRKGLTIGVGIGLAVSGISYLSSHGIASALAGVGGAVTALALQAGIWVRRSAARLRFA